MSSTLNKFLYNNWEHRDTKDAINIMLYKETLYTITDRTHARNAK